MITRLALAGLALLSSAALALADTYPRNPDIDIHHYIFRLALTDGSDEIAGHTTVDLRFTRAGVSQFALDLVGRSAERQGRGMTVEAVTEDGAALPFQHGNNRVRIQLTRPPDAGERRRITIAYRGVPADGLVISKNKHGDRTFFGDSFPDRARHWLPTLDHPSDKATCEFIVTAPDRYRVIATGLKVEETDLPDAARLTHWRTAVSVSTYNMVVGVARFAVQYVDRRDGVSLETWAFPQDREAWFRGFAVAPRILDFFARRVGPYPYEKLANVQSRTRFGGMENAGNIFYGQNLSAERGVEGIAAHEIAHQWFGDSVTESDWNHAWLSEGFATYFTHLYREFTDGHARLVEGLRNDRQAIVKFLRKNRDARIVDPREPVSRILNTYTYQKGGWVLHMLRREVGDEKFWIGIREYYRRYRDRNALSEDFRDVMERASGVDLDGFFQQWLYEPGHPRLRATWAYDSVHKVLSITIDQTQVGKPFAFSVDLGLTLADGTRKVETIEIAETSRTVALPLDTPPIAITVDPDTWLLAEYESVRR